MALGVDLRSLEHRRRLPEVMDRDDLEPDRHRGALRGLARLNAWSGAARPFWSHLRELGGRGEPLSVVDLACGAGDLIIELAHRAARAGLSISFEGWDRSPVAVGYAQERARARGVDVRFHAGDILAGEVPACDVSLSTLFFHHLDEDQAVSLLSRMSRAARKRVLVCDLERSASGLSLAWAASHLLTRSDVVHVDGPRSVRGAFTRAEALRLAERAGLDPSRVDLTRQFPFRWLLCWRATG